MDASDEEFEENNLKKLYLNSKIMYEKPSVSQKTENISKKLCDSKENVMKKLECLTFFDIVETNKDDLDYVVEHSPKYNIPIYLNPAFDKFDFRKQVSLLCSYHTKISKNIATQARLQIENVPLPKLIDVFPKPQFLRNNEDGQVENKSNTSSDFNVYNEYHTEDYVNRFGRITKRKFYTETLDIELKKQRMVSGDWISKTSTPKTSGYVKTPTSETEKSHIDRKKISKENLDIMKRSSLFQDKELKNTRSAKILKGAEEKIVEDEEREGRLKTFEKTLSNKEEMETVIPTLKQKPGRQKKVKGEFKVQSQNYQRSPSPNIRNERGDGSKSPDCFDTLRNEASTSTSFTKKANKKMVQCPICSRNFAEAEIEKHAASCGENLIETRSHPTQISCQYCDKVFTFDSEFDNHVKTCNSRSTRSK